MNNQNKNFMKKISVVVETDKKKVSKKEQRYIIDKIMEIKNKFGVQINIEFV